MDVFLWQLKAAFLATIIIVMLVMVSRIVRKFKQQIYHVRNERDEFKEHVFSNPNPMLRIDKLGICYFANFYAESILAEWQININQKIPPKWFEVITQILESDKMQAIEMKIGKRTYLTHVVPIKGLRAILYFVDITSYKNLQKALASKATQDEQTKLPNQVVFKRDLEEKCQASEKRRSNLGVLIVRFEDYAQIVYTYGQDIANAILIELSTRLKEMSHDEGIVARLSDNEFGLLDPQIGQMEDASNYIQSIIQECTQRYCIDNRDIFISISVGVTFSPTDGITADDLARNAQLALNRAKLSSTNFAFFKRGMEEQIVKRREIIADLHGAIDDGQFFLVYQPQVDLKTLTLIGCEALIRWQHPEKGLISPFHFIPAAEEANLIIPIGTWVLRETCLQIVKWRNQGRKAIKVAVNLSAQQVLESDLTNQIKELIDDYQITPEWLSFELTESALVEDKELAIKIMNEIKALGFELSIDDFGTGYSSLSYLVQFPIDKIKIDRSFIIEIKDEIEGHAVTKGIINLGHDMGLKVVAEGAETDEQINYLKGASCDIIQGYYFGKPEKPEDFAQFFNNPFKMNNNHKQNKKPIRVGILHSLTGTMALSEEPVANATLMAIDEINAKGGVLGRQIEAIKADGQSSPEVFAQKAKELIEQQKARALFGIWNSHSRKAVKEVVEAKNHLLIYPMAYEGLEISSNIFYTGGTANQVLMPTIKWAFENLGKRFFIVGSDYIGPVSNMAITVDLIQSLGGEVVGEAYILLGDLDFEQIVNDIVKAKPDVILNNNNGEANMTFIQALRKQGITSDKTPTISFNMNEVGFQCLPADMVKGDYAAWNYFQNITIESNQNFIKRYRDRFGQSLVTGDTIEAAYFGVYLWAQAVKDAGTAEPSQVIKHMHGQKFNAPGGPVQIDRANHHTWKSARIAKVNHKGELVIVWNSGELIAPVPYPRYKTREEWEKFLLDHYKKWGNRWYNT